MVRFKPRVMWPVAVGIQEHNENEHGGVTCMASFISLRQHYVQFDDLNFGTSNYHSAFRNWSLDERR